jgi:hypothetical protein
LPEEKVGAAVRAAAVGVDARDPQTARPSMGRKLVVQGLGTQTA